MPRSRAARPVDEETLRRALEFLALPHGRVQAACVRYGVTEYALRRAQKTLGPVRLSLEDLVLSGLSKSKPSTPADLQPYLDWLDHVVYPEEEIHELLRSLCQQGLERERKGGFVLLADWP
jgi:hypothetical protein